jgi:hypothetical protein
VRSHSPHVPEDAPDPDVESLDVLLSRRLESISAGTERRIAASARRSWG